MAVYLDSHSTTPLDPQVFEEMKPYFLEKFGNASSTTHSFGWDADIAVENARKKVAQFINCQPKEIFFTSGATESNNIALQGVIKSFENEKIHIISSLIEHKATLETLKNLAQNGIIELTLLKPDSSGVIPLDNIQNSVRTNTKLLSLIWASNEIGTIQNIQEISNFCQDKNILFHLDACQGMAYLPMDVQKFNISLLTISAHKMYGPKGIGALFVRQIPKRVRLKPIIFGAGQEKETRPGTLNVPGIVGLGSACEIAKKEMSSTSKRILELRDYIILEMLKLPFVQLNGHASQRLPNNIHFTLKGVPFIELIRALPNFALSSGSACTSGSTEPSHVLLALGLSEEDILNSFRIGLHKYLTLEDCKLFVSELKRVSVQLFQRSNYYKS